MTMQRSDINEILAWSHAFFERYRFRLPPFGYWSLEDWRAHIPQTTTIRARGLGWDITDYGAGDFFRTGLTLFTVRNGNINDMRLGKGMVYAEKIMIGRKNQISPMHFHKVKAEDIINRGGGRLVVQVYNSDAKGGLDRNKPVEVTTDGQHRSVAPGTEIVLTPGESITLWPLQHHSFWAVDDDVLIGEVSTVNDDRTDNYFLEALPRFPKVLENTSPQRLLVSDYETFLTPVKP